MDISRVPQLIASLHPDMPPVFLVGNTGIGKTQTVAQGAALCGRTLGAIPPLSTMEPEDAAGIPIPDIEEGIVRFMPPHYWKVGPLTIIFFDELNLARAPVISALTSVLCPLADGRRRIGSLLIPEDTLVIAAGMPPQPGSPARQLPQFVRSRLRIVSVEADTMDWIAWASREGLDPTVISFIYSNQSKLAPPPPTGSDEIVAFPTPRGWHNVSRLITDERNTTGDEDALIISTVGPGAGGDFLRYRKNMKLLPAPDKILDGTEEFPSNASAAVAAASSIISYVISQKDPLVAAQWVHRSQEWPVEYVIGIQFPAVNGLTPFVQEQVGLSLEQIAELDHSWLDLFGSAINVSLED